MVKKKIDQIYEYIERTILAGPQGKGIRTDEVAAALHMQRTNVSTLLNQLVNQGRLTKSNSRPVVYDLISKDQNDHESRLDQVVGRNGSLKMLVDRLEALISYPGEHVRIMIVSEAGNEHEYIARCLYEYAVQKGIFAENAPYVALNCVHYLKSIDILNEKLFGLNDLSISAFAHAENGILYIRNVQYLNAEQQARINEFIEYGLIYDQNHTKFRQCRHITLLLSAPEDQVPRAFAEMQQVRIPPLKERPLEEKFNLINRFFQGETRQAGIAIGVSTQALCALLMADLKENVRGIEVEIRSACASAYVRALGSHQTEMQVMMHDFSANVRKGLLSDKKDNTVISILKNTGGDIVYFNETGINATGQMYTSIKERINDLLKKGIDTDEINGLLSSALVPHMMDLAGDSGESDDKKLSKIIDARIVAVVDICLHEYEKRNNKKLDASVYNAMCLQIHAFEHHQGGIRISDAEVKGIVEGHPVEFETCLYISSCLSYAKVIEGNLTVNETAALTRIMMNDHPSDEKHPVVLYAMHGDHTASALAEVTNALTHLDNAYAFDLCLSYSTEEAMRKLKEKLEKINQGQGIIAIYDMGSIGNMLNTIMEETNMNIRMVNSPVTLLGLDAAWKSYEMVDVDDVYNDICTMMRNHREEPERKSELIVCLCETGQGGAQELKRYIDEYSHLNIKTAALAISNKSVLIQRVSDLQKIYNIHAFVGTYDPKLFGIPFIAMNRVFHAPHEHLDQILMFEPIEDRMQDYEQVYQMLAESLRYTSISKLKTTLPEIVDQLSESYQLNDNQKDGLFVHLACSVERLLSGDDEKPLIDEEQKKKIMRLNEDYGVVSRQIRKLEKAFNVIFDDNEIATIIMILRKI